MKRVLLMLLAAMLCMSGALAEADGFWTANADWYYHASEFCGGEEDRVPISPEGADMFGKYACPVCISTQESDEVQAVVIFGQLVLRIPDAWLAGLENPRLPRIESEAGGVDESGEEALRTLKHCLHGESYVRFLDELRENGHAEGTAVTLQILPTGDDIVLSTRHIGDAWYACVRPTGDPEEGWDLTLGITEIEIQMEEDALHTQVPYRMVVKTFCLQPELKPAASCVYQREGEGIQVYQALGAYFLDYTAELEEDHELFGLYIDDVNLDAALAAWRSGSIANFGCPLTEAESRALENGAALKLEFTEA